MKYILSFLVVSVALTLTFSSPQRSRYIGGNVFGNVFRRNKVARVQLVPAKNTGKDPVYGSLQLQETAFGVRITGKIFGLEPGKHGFHVHAVGDLGDDCKAAKGHFNPQMKNHGKPGMLDNRHVGDLGNIFTYPDGFTSVNVIDSLVTLESGAENDISGRAFVVHAGEDDLGMGGDAESLKTGNAGKRLACGIVQPITY